MRPDLQQAFIDRVTPDSYERFKRELDDWLEMTIQYRVCEMPIFVSDAFRQQLEAAAVEIIQQCSSPEAVQRTESTLEDRYRVPHEADRPLHSVVDFAVCSDGEGGFTPRLIELQGFPSLLGYQYAFGQRMISQYALPGMTPLLGGLDHDAYLDLLRTATYADADPEATFLMEIDPEEQKTLSDFRALKRYIGLETINIRDVRKQGRSLVIPTAGGDVPIQRIFNRAIIDELEDLHVDLDFAWNDDLDVEWAGHPNWYFRISKFSLPYIDHWSAPETHFLDTLDTIPEPLSDYVLKPLYSFAGKGVNVHPTQADLDAVPADQRSHWILQRKVEYAACIPTPYGMNKVEIRVMLIWLPGEASPRPVMSMARTGRAAMMGARYNVDPWTGSSGCLFVE